MPPVLVTASELPGPVPCEACGLDTAPEKIGVLIESNTKTRGHEVLATLCISCYARAVVWAAKQSLPTDQPTIKSEPAKS